MKKSLPAIQYSRLQALYVKLTARLNKQFTTGRFSALSKVQQVKLLQRIERIKAQLHRLSLGLKLGASALALGAIFYSADAQAQFAAVGSEFQVNTYTSRSQQSSSIAMDSDGNFVVVWESSDQEGIINYYGIYAQRYNSLGVAQGLEFMVNTYTTNEQRWPSVAMDIDGDFVVTWQSRYQDGNNEGIYAQRYNSLGVAQGLEFRVNTYTTSAQYLPAIAMDSDGDFVITWISQDQDGSSEGIYAQRYNSIGISQGAEFKVNTYTTSLQSDPSIAMDSDGDFVVTWFGLGLGASVAEIYAQRYNALGVSQGTEFKVNTYTTSSQSYPSIAIDNDGDFVITWMSDEQDGYSSGCYGQRYNALGVAQGVEFRINTHTTYWQAVPSVAMDIDGNFLVTWNSLSDTQDGDGLGIYAQRYNASGVPLDLEFRINTYTTSHQRYSSVAMDSDGDFVVTWSSTYQDGSDQGVYAQRYTGGFTTAIQTTQETSAFVLYPNPAKDQVHLNLEGEVNVKIMDLSGQVLKEVKVENQSFNIAGLKAGVYIVELNKGGEKVVKKLMVE